MSNTIIKTGVSAALSAAAVVMDRRTPWIAIAPTFGTDSGDYCALMPESWP